MELGKEAVKPNENPPPVGTVEEAVREVGNSPVKAGEEADGVAAADAGAEPLRTVAV